MIVLALAALVQLVPVLVARVPLPVTVPSVPAHRERKAPATALLSTATQAAPPVVRAPLEIVPVRLQVAIVPTVPSALARQRSLPEPNQPVLVLARRNPAHRVPALMASPALKNAGATPSPAKTKAVPSQNRRRSNARPGSLKPFT